MAAGNSHKTNYYYDNLNDWQGEISTKHATATLAAKNSRVFGTVRRFGL